MILSRDSVYWPILSLGLHGLLSLFYVFEVLSGVHVRSVCCTF